MVDNETNDDEPIFSEGPGAATDPAPADAPDAWDTEGTTPKRTVLYAQIGLVALILSLIVIVLVVKGGSDDASDDKDTAAKTTQPTGTGTAKPNAKPAWPRAVEGRPTTLGKRGQKAPDITPKAKPGVYVWSDFDGWHMWIVGGTGMPATIDGTLTSNDPIARAELAVPDTGTVSTDGKVVTYSLDTSKPLSGIDFNTGFYGKRLVFTFNGPDGPIDGKLLHTGSKAAAAVYPLVIDKA